MSNIGYPIKIEFQGFRKIRDTFNLSQYSNIVLCVDPEVAKLYKEMFEVDGQKMFVLPKVGEESKSISVLQEICEFFKKSKVDRHTVIVSVGGGVTGDVVGFAAAIYMRGIAVLHVPTTLLSMVDSSVGAKTAINFSGVKNLIGAFHPPIGVLIDVDFLITLPKNQFYSGFAEVIKHGVISDTEYFKTVSNQTIDVSDVELLSSVISKSIQIKSAVVVADPKESGIRKILNFGHTIGHCIESLTGKLHGEAVAIGMVLEAKLASMVLATDSNLIELIKEALNKYNLPTSLENKIKWESFSQLLLLDKKNKDQTILFALPSKLGSCQYDIPVSLEMVRSVVEGE